MNYIRDNTKLTYMYEIDLNIPESEENGNKSTDELQDQLSSAIEKLPGRCREIFIMAKILKKPYAKIASELGISENTVKVQVSKAYHILRFNFVS